MTAYGKTKTYTWEHGRELSSLTQPAPMAITKQPADCKGILGTAISFSVTAKGEGLSYQWQVSSNGGSAWADTSANGATTNTISGFTVTEARDGNMYRCVITDGNGNSVTSSAKSIIATDLAITKQPGTFKGLLGDVVKFSVTVRGEGLTYQWQCSTDDDIT